MKDTHINVRGDYVSFIKQYFWTRFSKVYFSVEEYFKKYSVMKRLLLDKNIKQYK